MPGSLLVLAVLLLEGVVFPAAQQPASRFSHARCLDPFAQQLLDEGIVRSPTMRRLLETLERSDVVAYLSVVRFEETPHAMANTKFLVAAGGSRYLVISVAARNTRDAQIALMGHELEHATEIAAASRVRDSRDMAGLYERIGRRHISTREYETYAAGDTGVIVAWELAQNRPVAHLGADKARAPSHN